MFFDVFWAFGDEIGLQQVVRLPGSHGCGNISRLRDRGGGFGQTLIVGDFNPVSSIEMGVSWASFLGKIGVFSTNLLVSSVSFKEGIVSRLRSGSWLR